MTLTETVWKGEHRFESTHEGNSIKVDGDKVEGHGPKALLLSGLAGCSGIDVVDILEKMRVPFTDLRITAEAGLVEEHPKVFTHIVLTYRINVDPTQEDKVRKAIDLSLEKYCGVAAMLRKNSPIEYKLELI
ncbi:MAG: OsmC family protein [Chitinophagaceae bacterium]|nr:OsmC family protein [Chitinophagaceae bacterium]